MLIRLTLVEIFRINNASTFIERWSQSLHVL